MKSKKPLIGIVALTAAAVGATAAPEMAAAYWGLHSIQVSGQYSYNPIVGFVSFADAGGGMQSLSHVQNQESWVPVSGSARACDTQGLVATKYAGDPALYFLTYSGYNAGCAFFRSYSYSNYNSSVDPVGTCYLQKWTSTSTGGSWLTIGTLCA